MSNRRFQSFPNLRILGRRFLSCIPIKCRTDTFKSQSTLVVLSSIAVFLSMVQSNLIKSEVFQRVRVPQAYPPKWVSIRDFSKFYVISNSILESSDRNSYTSSISNRGMLESLTDCRWDCVTGHTMISCIHYIYCVLVPLR